MHRLPVTRMRVTRHRNTADYQPRAGMVWFVVMTALILFVLSGCATLLPITWTF